MASNLISRVVESASQDAGKLNSKLDLSKFATRPPRRGRKLASLLEDFEMKNRAVVALLVAFVLAVPVTWFIMHKWLEDFAYRINIGWWVFAAAGMLSVLIALVTISFQAIKAAIANPVKSLRTE